MLNVSIHTRNGRIRIWREVGYWQSKVWNGRSLVGCWLSHWYVFGRITPVWPPLKMQPLPVSACSHRYDKSLSGGCVSVANVHSVESPTPLSKTDEYKFPFRHIMLLHTLTSPSPHHIFSKSSHANNLGGGWPVDLSKNNICIWLEENTSAVGVVRGTRWHSGLSKLHSKICRVCSLVGWLSGHVPQCCGLLKEGR